MQPRQSGHRYIETIKTYYQGCNTADFELMMSTFDTDVVHYFNDHSAVRGAEALANYWCKVGPRTEANWVLDHAIVQDTEAVIEWSMRWTPAATGLPEILRGAERYVFNSEAETDGSVRICEIRSYHNNFYLADPANRALHDFDYAGRGYRVR